MVLDGGLPIYNSGFPIGGIGISASTVAQDTEVATAGANADLGSTDVLTSLVCGSWCRGLMKFDLSDVLPQSYG